MLWLLGVVSIVLAFWVLASPFVLWWVVGQSRALQRRLALLELAVGDLRRQVGGGYSTDVAASWEPLADLPRSIDEQSSTRDYGDTGQSRETGPAEHGENDDLENSQSSVPRAGPSSVEQSSSPHVDLADATSNSSSTRSLEETLGTRWAVYGGGLALALGGIFLVHYSIEAGLLGPRVRIALGLLLAAVLVAAGEWFRRTDKALGVAGAMGAHIPSILTAAGTVCAFATLYASHALFGFIGPALAFVALGAIGIATMLASALHGPALAGLGIAGSYVTPLIISSKMPNPWALVLFLGVVATSALLLARLRRWLWLAVAAVVGAVAWGVVILSNAPQFGDVTDAVSNGSWLNAGYIHAIVQLALAAVIVAVLPHIERNARPIVPDWIATACLAALAGLSVLVLEHASPLDSGWLPFALTAVIILAATAYVALPSAGAGVLGGLVVVGMSLVWPATTGATPLPYIDSWIGGALRRPEPVSSYLAVLIIGAIPVVAVALLRLWRAHRFAVTTTGLYALSATVIPLVLLVISYMRVAQFEGSVRFMVAGFVLTSAFWGLAEYFLRREHGTVPDVGFHDESQDSEPSDIPSEVASARLITGAFASAGIAALCFALCVIVDRSLLKSALALTALGVAVISTTRNIPILRHVVWAIGLAVLVRIVGEPTQMLRDIGTTPIFNWLLVAYGIPALAFYLAGRVLRYEREIPDMATHICDGLAIVFGALLCFFEIRHLVHGGDVLTASVNHIEAGLMAFTAFALAQVTFRHAQVIKGWTYDVASQLLGWVGGLTAVVGVGLFNNPYLSAEKVEGGPLASSLLLAYLLPGVMALYVARVSRGVRDSMFTTAATVVGLGLVFLYVTLEVRHLFQGEVISMWRTTSGAESWAYTVAWLALGLGFLAYGFWRKITMPRVVSAVLIVLACVKVVAIDLAGVSGLWRALSFLCLGVVLMGIGLFYQRVIFAPTRRDKSRTTSELPS